MDDQKRLIVFVVSVIIVMLIFSRISPPPVPPEQPPPVTEEIPREDPPEELPPVEPEPVIEPEIDEPETVPPEVEEIPEQTLLLETEVYTLTISNRGGVISDIILNEYSDEERGTAHILIENEKNLYPFALQINGELIDAPLPMEKTEHRDAYYVSFTYPQYDFDKVLRIPKEGYLIDVFFEGNTTANLDIELLLSTGLLEDIAMERVRHRVQSGALVLIGNRLNTDRSIDADDYTRYRDNIRWGGIQSKYFMIVGINNGDIDEMTFRGTLLNGEEQPTAYASLRRLPDANNPIQVFSGPKEYRILRDYDWDMQRVIFHSMLGTWFRWLCTGLHQATYYITRVVRNYGVSILILTLIVKIILFPLTYSSMKSMSKMQLLQPRIQELKEKYAKDQKKQQQEMMKLWKEYNVNPMGGCLPLFFQMPIFIALYRVFNESIMFRGAGFALWINDLSQPDTIAQMGAALPFIGNNVNILPLFNGFSMFVQQKMTMKDPKQKAMVYIMPIFITVLLYNLPSGLLLYWSFSNVLSIGQQFIINKKMKHQTKDLHKDLKKI